MNFERLAPYYHPMECLMAGGLMQRCRTAFLSRTEGCRNALLIGEGTGRFLTELLRLNPHLQVVCVEHSETMVKQAKRRLAREHLDASKVQFITMDILEWTPPVAVKFDLVATHFFLDCFRAEQLKKLVSILAGSTSRNAIWLLADFQLPEGGWQRWRAKMILASLYLFFRMITSLSASRLTPPDEFLLAAGFTLAGRRLASLGLMHSDIWEKSPVAPDDF